MGVVETILQPDLAKASEISTHDFPKDWPSSIGSENALGGHGMSVTRFAWSEATELHDERAPSSNSKPSADFQAFPSPYGHSPKSTRYEQILSDLGLISFQNSYALKIVHLQK